jgi:hypothetical protein
MKTKTHQKYRLRDKTIVPGVTTFTGQLDKPALLYWAWDLGCKGIDYKKYKDNLADIGTLAHDMIVSHLLGKEPDVSDYSTNQISLAENAVLSYFEWEKGKEIEVIDAEKQLTSETLKFGGTFDLLCLLDGKLTLVDFKTGKAIYPEMAIQLSAYSHLIVENIAAIPTNHMILRIGRDETEGFEVKQYTPEQIETGWEIFKNLINIYYLRKEIK